MRFRDMVLLALCLALAGCGKKGSKGVDGDAPPEDLPPQDLPAEAQGTVVRTGSVKLPPGAVIRPSELQVVSAFEEATPDADGSFDVRVAETRNPQFVFSLDPETGNPVLVGYTGPAAGGWPRSVLREHRRKPCFPESDHDGHHRGAAKGVHRGRQGAS